MTEEEKNAVEFVKERTEELKKIAKRENELVYDDIILNLINKLQKENENFEKLNKDYSYSVDIVRENTRLRRQVFDLELENTKLKKQNQCYINSIQAIVPVLTQDYVPKQEIKDKIKEYKSMLKTCNKAQDVDRIKAINERVLELQELLGSEE